MAERLNALSATEAARRIARGAITAEELARACLAHIEEREPEVAAWAYLDREDVIRQAKTRDMMPGSGALHGVPVAFKDIVDTAEQPTAYGSPIYRGHRPAADAACVANARAAGAVVLGKTVTTEFAARYPGPTRNPHNPLHTPGGSSSGSAAAVADGMVPLAVGTQTAGSVIRPAAYCGVYGYKASFGLLSFSGVRHLAESLDTLGCMARTLEDLALFRDAMLGCEPRRFEPAQSPPRVGLCRTPGWDEAEEHTRSLVEEGASRLSAAGARVSDVELSERFAGSEKLHGRIMAFEARRCLTADVQAHPGLLSRAAQRMVDAGAEVGFEQYLAAQREAEALRRELAEAMTDYDVLLTPSANGEAPAGLGFTGPVTFNYLWTLLHTPTVTVPAFTGPSGLPVGAQLVGRRWDDDRLLAAAAWVAANIG